MKVEVLICDQESLAKHVERGAVLELSSEYDLETVAIAVAKDDLIQIKDLLKNEKLTLVSNELKKEKYNCAIVQPYVLIQECE